MNEREAAMREPDAESGNYEAQAASSAPPDMQAIDERAATTKTQPMGRLENQQAQRQQAEGIQDGSLIHDQKLQYFAGRWDSIQAGFVDEPRRTVEQADRLVAEVIDHLAKMFRDERAKLEAQWSRSGKADTEDLRLAMQRYRDFFRTLVGR